MREDDAVRQASHRARRSVSQGQALEALKRGKWKGEHQFLVADEDGAGGVAVVLGRERLVLHLVQQVAD
eukprot:1029134-Rhodomonas_salina.2